jgi:predicted alpha/beta superfamily hydrolase
MRSNQCSFRDSGAEKLVLFGLLYLSMGWAFLFPAKCADAQAGANAAWSRFDLTNAEQAVLSSAGGGEYRLVVARPSAPPPPEGYPVIYVVDGNAWTVLVAEIIRTNLQFGTKSKTVPAVVVGIGYPIADAFDVKRRAHDLTPTTRFGSDVAAVTDGPGDARLSGGDLEFMDFIEHQVKPLVESRFPIDKSKQVLVGHSLGGLFTLDTLMNRPSSYQTYVALSPSLWWDGESVFSRAQKFLESRVDVTKFRVFVSVGNLEQYWTDDYRKVVQEAFIRQADKQRDGSAASSSAVETERLHRDATKWYKMVELSARLDREFLARGIDTKYVVFPAEDHFSVVPAALGTAIPYALQGAPRR